jgi:NAD(P)-dependent dehydrogenase (short-subunit alcohol dehydrogenase family)
MSKLPELFDLHGQVAIVTGGAGLLGSQFCQTLAQAGASVVIADANTTAAATLADSINASGDSAISLAVDVTDPTAVDQMVERTLASQAHLDILVNSAALDPKFDSRHGGHTNAFEDYPLEAWNQAINVNLTGMFLCCRAVAHPMLAQKKGVIINLSSIYGLTAPDQRLYQQPGQPPQYKPVYYSVTKYGVLGLTAYLAAYFAGKNIRVNTLSPGGVFNQHDDGFTKAYSARTMLGRMAADDDLNGALLFLASDASAYMTGANLVVDGGWSAW